jgi:hypothetical protein
MVRRAMGNCELGTPDLALPSKPQRCLSPLAAQRTPIVRISGLIVANGPDIEVRWG